MGAKKGHAEIEFSFSLGPVKDAKYNISGRLGNFQEELIGEYYPKVLSKKVNVIVSELVNNVVEHAKKKNTGFSVRVKIDSKQLVIRIKNVVSPKQYEKVKEHVRNIRKSKNTKELLVETIKKRRKKGLKGGLGLIRLTAENKAVLSVSYSSAASFMTITSKLDLKGLL